MPDRPTIQWHLGVRILRLQYCRLLFVKLFCQFGVVLASAKFTDPVVRECHSFELLFTIPHRFWSRLVPGHPYYTIWQCWGSCTIVFTWVKCQSPALIAALRSRTSLPSCFFLYRISGFLDYWKSAEFAPILSCSSSIPLLSFVIPFFSFSIHVRAAAFSPTFTFPWATLVPTFLSQPSLLNWSFPQSLSATCRDQWSTIFFPFFLSI